MLTQRISERIFQKVIRTEKLWILSQVTISRETH